MTLQAAEPPQPAAPPMPAAASGDVVLASAVNALTRYESLTASVRQRVRLFGHDLYGSGQYVQRGTGPLRKFRLELAIQGKNQKITCARICDGRLLYLVDDVGGTPTCRFVDLRRVQDALTMAEQAGAIDWRQFDIGFGGLPRLLAACEANFRFAAAGQSELNGLPVWVLRGHWKPDRLTAMLASPEENDKQKPGPPARLPAHIPNEVVLYLGRDDLFPYCIEFRAVTPAKDKQGVESQILAAMDFFEVRLDTQVEEKQFFGPNLPQNDDTEAYLKRMGIPRTGHELRAEQKR